jgi:hypothetical protein
MNRTLALVLMVFGIVGCSSTTFNPSADHWVSMPSTSLCFTYYSNYGVARMKQWRYENYSRIINEIDRRGINCQSFAKPLDRDWMRDWVKNYDKEEDIRLANARELRRLGQEKMVQARKVNTADTKEERLKYEKEWEAHSQKVLEEERLLKERAFRKEEEKKKKILADLTIRCEEYGFTGESNISACIQREAQHDKELAMQKYELQKTRVALQHAQSQAQSRAYAQSLPPVVEEEEEMPWLIKFLGDVAIGVAEQYPAAVLEAQQKQDAYNRGVKKGRAQAKPNCGGPNCY